MAWNYLDTTLPPGISAGIVCLYQFDGYPNGLLDRSGNGRTLRYFGSVNPRWSRIDGVGVYQAGPNSWLGLDVAVSGVFNTLGELTVEWVGGKSNYINANQYIFCIGDLTSSTESLNAIAALYVGDSSHAKYSVIHERGSGVNVVTDAQYWTEPLAGLHHGVLTRESDGKTYKIYSDGVLLETLVASDPPTGGTGSIRIHVFGGGTTSIENYGYCSSFRYVKERFTAEQVLASFNRVHV